MSGADFTNLVNMVYTETNRLDLVAETKQAVMEATLSAHLLDYFYKDLMISQLSFAALDYIQQIDTTALTRFRKMNFLRLTDSTLLWPAPVGNASYPMFLPPGNDAVGGGGVTNYSIIGSQAVEIKEIEIDDIFDEFNSERRNVWYQAGTNVIVRTYIQFQYLLISYYQRPDITEATYTSWIGTDYPYSIVYKAAKGVFNKIGQTEAAAAFGDVGSGMIGEQNGILIKNNVTTKGF